MKLAHLIVAAGLGLAATLTHALEIKPYSAAALQQAQQAGEPVALHFHADWCTVCQAQEKVLNELKSSKDLDLKVLVVDYDKEKALNKKLNVRSQSTLVVYKGEKETARLAGESDSGKIQAALKTAL